MGVALGMPADPDLLPILLKLKLRKRIGRSTRDWARRNLAAAPSAAPISAVTCAPGLEDTFYLADGAE